MSVIIALTAIALWGMIATVDVVRRDGYRPIPTRTY